MCLYCIFVTFIFIYIYIYKKILNEKLHFFVQCKNYISKRIVTKCVPEFAALKARKLVKGVVNDIENQYHETSLKI